MDRTRRAPSRASRSKHELLSQKNPSATRSTSGGVAAKDADVFLFTLPDGQLPLGNNHGFGLFWRDTRYLSGYELHVNGESLDSLMSDTRHGQRVVFQLCNQTLDPCTITPDGIPRGDIGVRWTRAIDGAQVKLQEELVFENFGVTPLSFLVDLRLRADFADVFLVRGLVSHTGPQGVVSPPAWDAGVLHFRYTATDGFRRALTMSADPAPDQAGPGSARFRVHLAPRETHRIALTFTMSASDVQPCAGQCRTLDGLTTAHARELGAWRDLHTRVQSASVLTSRVVERAIDDLGMLRTPLGEDLFFSAGIPWFATLFGRDSLITAMQTLAFNSDSAAATLRVLGRFQGTHDDAWRDEQPGKILHELRRGELARLGEIPHTPYYGSIDSTPLYLCVVERHAVWTGSLALFHELRDVIEGALGWIDRACKADGYARYASSSAGAGLVNQGWKDSGDAIVNADGSLAVPPIALVEEQGYIYRAWRGMARLFRRAGDGARADALDRRADEMRARVLRDFWLPDRQFYALALQAGNRPCAVESSNPGHLLWSGLLPLEAARLVAERLLAPAMFGGWGIRTLSSAERRYNPVGYHLGTVWPHDNSIIAAGMRRYGLDTEALRVCDAVLDACTWFDDLRMPEVYAGFDDQQYDHPVPYPVACRPQAWGAGAVLSMVQTMLGIAPDGFEGKLHIRRPLLPTHVPSLRLTRLRVGAGEVDLAFTRRNGGVTAEVTRRDGPVEVDIETG